MVELQSIKEMLKLSDVDILEVEYRKSLLYLKPLILRTEKTLINAQNETEPDTKRIEQIEKSYRALVFVYGHISKQDSRIKELQKQVDLLNGRLSLHGNL
jgi:hypothetical protein